jgi:colanic acid/amylovoran/stewartan biosynthesis glycosyltransferase WcaL/AmsK/CpsK
MHDGRYVVAQCVRVWLPRTETWLYSEVTSLGARWRSRVIANRRVNPGEFPWEDVYSMRDAIGGARWFAEMSLTRAGVFRCPPSMASELRRLRPQVVHSHFGHVGWANTRTVRALGARHVVSFYGHDLTRLPRLQRWQRRYRELFENVDLVLCEGPHMRSRLVELGCPPATAQVYPLGVPVARIHYRAPRWAQGDTLRLLIAAGFREKKGIPDALAAIGELRRRRPTIPVTVTVVGAAGGSAESRREEVRIRAGVAVSALEDVITFRGSMSHDALLALASEHDVFVSPSVTAADGDSEGGAPVGLIEMAALGLPVVSTRHCDIPYVLGAPNRELLVAEHDVDSLAATLECLVDHPETWVDLSAANRAHIAEHLDVARQGPALARIYEELVHGS